MLAGESAQPLGAGALDAGIGMQIDAIGIFFVVLVRLVNPVLRVADAARAVGSHSAAATLTTVAVHCGSGTPSPCSRKLSMW